MALACLAVSPASAQDVSAVFSSIVGERMSRAPGLVFEGNAPEAEPTYMVDEAHIHQKIDGFGASASWRVARA